MFKHEDSETFAFAQKCTNKLCQCKHTESLENEDGKAEGITIEMKTKFKKLSEIERLESKELLCDINCKASFGYHIVQMMILKISLDVMYLT